MQEGIALQIWLYEGYLHYMARIDHLHDDDGISWRGDINIPFATINEMSDDDIVESIRLFAEEAKKQIKEEK